MSEATPMAQVFQRDDGLFEVGLTEPLGPFETRAFAEAVAAHEVARAMWLRRNSRHSPLPPGSI
ncbi:hypothetical protein [Bradyrhizobium sp. S3.9.1]|uniref:hypothetical protein n=1 Tax=Bradyrhizobium sp. S3.9.1 TaxID=3156431 RepID=UPI003398C4B0